MSQQITTYIQLQVKNRNRATVFFRAILVIPIAILAASFGGYSSNRSHSNWLFMNPAGVLMIPVVLTLLFLGVYPSYVLQFNKAIVALSVRISSRKHFEPRTPIGEMVIGDSSLYCRNHLCGVRIYAYSPRVVHHCVYR